MYSFLIEYLLFEGINMWAVLPPEIRIIKEIIIFFIPAA